MPNRDRSAKTCTCGLPGQWQAVEEGNPPVTGHIAVTFRENWERDAVLENRMRRAAQRQGLMPVKFRRRDSRAIGYGLYVLVEDKAGHRRPPAQAPISAFARGEGMTLAEAAEELLP